MVQGCMSRGGIPVQPYFVLGGFKGDNYQGKLHKEERQVNSSVHVYLFLQHGSQNLPYLDGVMLAV